MDKDIKEMYEGHNFNKEDNKLLFKYYSELQKAMQEQIDLWDIKDADFSKAIKMHDELPIECKKFVDEVADHCLTWRYSDQDIVELCEELVKEIKYER